MARPVLQGWHAHYKGRLGEARSLEPSAALVLQAGETAHPELRERGFVVEFTGQVLIPTAGRYRFGVEAQGGQASLGVSTQSFSTVTRTASSSAAIALTGWAQLEATAVHVTVRFERAARGDGKLRTLWERAPSATGGFALEPIPSSAVRVPDSLRSALEPGLAERRGRLLLQAKGCTNCHAPDAAESAAVGVRTAPRISGITDRLAPDWVRAWLLHPVRNDGTSDMPDLFRDAPEREHSAEDLLHYLASLEKPHEPEPVADPATGRQLFHTLGCVACHGALDSPSTLFGDPVLSKGTPDAIPVRALGNLRSKWNRSALPGFLRDPTSIHPDGQMPDFALTATESRALAAYLGGDGGFFEIDPERVVRGRHTWVEHRCGACHALDADAAIQAPAKPLRQLRTGQGCLDAEDRDTPRYPLSETERGELILGLESVRRATGVRAPADHLSRELDRLGCTACHGLDGRGGPPEELRPYFTALDDRVDLGDEGRVPPDLSGVGYKLNTAWMKQVLEQGARARPYMATRMPRYHPDHVAGFPAGLAAQGGLGTDAVEREPLATDHRAREGRRLVGPEGLLCISCHLFQDFPPAGTPGPDIAAFAERLRYEWWSAYIQNPGHFKPGTRMPSFGVGRDSNLKSILDGDLLAQSDALWTYFNLGEFMPPPAGLEAPGALQIVVGDRPEVFRTFLKDVGSRGIAVGLPVGVHFGFNAKNSRLVHAWRGPFLSASSAWAGRGGQIATGQGDLIWKAPEGMPLLVGERPEQWPAATGEPAGVRFRGYRLDTDGQPWFRYTLGDLLILENFTAQVLPEERLFRKFRVVGAAAGQAFWLNAGEQRVALADPIGCQVERFGGANGQTANGQTWFRLIAEPGSTTMQFRLEIQP